MDIKSLNGLGSPKKVEKQSTQEIRSKKVEQNKSEAASRIDKGDEVQISKEARELQSTKDEIVIAKELLSRLPSARAHIIYEALAKIKAGSYSSEEIVDRAAEKLIESGELDDLIKP